MKRSSVTTDRRSFVKQLCAGSAALGAARAPIEIETLDVADFHLLRAVAGHGSINRAAAVLSISQPALTRRLQRLERRLGAPLFRRGSRGTALTSPAQQFLGQLMVLEGEFHAATLALRPGYPLPATAMQSRAPSP